MRSCGALSTGDVFFQASAWPPVWPPSVSALHPLSFEAIVASDCHDAFCGTRSVLGLCDSAFRCLLPDAFICRIYCTRTPHSGLVKSFTYLCEGQHFSAGECPCWRAIEIVTVFFALFAAASSEQSSAAQSLFSLFCTLAAANTETRSDDVMGDLCRGREGI